MCCVCFVSVVARVCVYVSVRQCRDRLVRHRVSGAGRGGGGVRGEDVAPAHLRAGGQARRPAQVGLCFTLHTGST